MMEAGTVFTTVSLMMLANGIVLAVVYRDLATTLRPAAIYWQLGTMLAAAGCVVFAATGLLPRPLMLLAANGFMSFALTAYYAAVQRFCNASPKLWQLLPASIATACVLWFSAISPNFHIRLIVVSAVWIFLMLASALTLLNSRTEDTSLSRWVLFGIFSVVAFYTLCRLAIYLVMGLSSDFAIESGVNWLNLLSPILMTLLPVVGTTAFLLMCSDKLRRQLEIAAATDYLTGLPNRRMLALLSTRGFEQATKQGGDFAVAVLDIDNFKAINDTHGHDAGDMVLVGVVDQFRSHADKVDMIARTGGEEFTVLFSGVPPNRVAETIEAVRSAVEAAAIYAGNIRIPVTISAGIAMYNPDDAMFEDMLRRADQALYSAKMAGRNRVEFPMSNVRPVEPGCIADDRQHLGA